MLIKLRFRFPEIFLGMFLAVAIFAMGAVFWSSQYSGPSAQSQSPEKRTEEKNNSQPNKGLWHWLTHDAGGFFTLWLVIVAGGQLALFYVQLKLIRDSLIDAEKAANAATEAAKAAKENAEYAKTNLLVLERAYIIPAFVPVEREAETWHVHILLTNVGRSFGTVKGLFAKFAEPNTLPVVPPENGYEKRITDTTLYPDSKNWPGLDPFIMSSKQEGQVIFGYIRYEDIFSRIWRQHFAVDIWSEKKPEGHFYNPVGGPAHHTEIKENQSGSETGPHP
jgi:hypothetical protein